MFFNVIKCLRRALHFLVKRLETMIHTAISVSFTCFFSSYPICTVPLQDSRERTSLCSSHSLTIRYFRDAGSPHGDVPDKRTCQTTIQFETSRKAKQKRSPKNKRITISRWNGEAHVAHALSVFQRETKQWPIVIQSKEIHTEKRRPKIPIASSFFLSCLFLFILFLGCLK